MKLSLVFLTLILHITSYSQSAQYCNARFDFCIPYPGAFQKQPEPENQDGLIFLSADKHTEIRAFGRLAIEDLNELSQEFAIASSEIKVTYHKMEKNWFIFSGIDKDGKIVYRKTVKKTINYMGQGKQEVFQTLMITYPATEQSTYGPYCKQIAKSL